LSISKDVKPLANLKKLIR